jgi:hypothetical protein
MSTKTANHPVGQFQWSAFGATYEDTICVDGNLGDLDDDGRTSAGIPCPFCNPGAYFEYQWGGGYVHPTCATCKMRLPEKAGTVTFHDGVALTWTGDCPTCGPDQPVLMRDYEAEDAGDDHQI